MERLFGAGSFQSRTIEIETELLFTEKNDETLHFCHY